LKKGVSASPFNINNNKKAKPCIPSKNALKEFEENAGF
jgi:hypothetical protein